MVVERTVAAPSDERTRVVDDIITQHIGRLTAVQEVLEDAAVVGKPGYSPTASMLVLLISDAEKMRAHVLKQIG